MRPPPRLSPSTFTWFAWLCASALLLSVAAAFVGYAVAAVCFPAGLSYSEGVVWQQLLQIPGLEMYGSIARYPFTVFEYPPVYYLAVRGVMAAGAGALEAGRGLSFAATLAACGLLARLIWRSCRRGWPALVGSAFGGLLPLTLVPVIAWVPTMRVDMLGLAITLVGVLLAATGLHRRARSYLAMTAFVAAVFTKQTFVAAPFAVTCIGLIRAPRATSEAVLFAGFTALAATALMVWLTQGGFLTHVLSYNINQFSLVSALQQLVYWTVLYAPFWALAALGIARTAWGHGLRWTGLGAGKGDTDDGSTVLTSTMVVYFGTLSLMTVLIGKSGSNVNYLIEWMWIGCFWIGRLIAAVLDAEALAAPSTARSRVLWSVVPLLLSFHLIKARAAVTGWRSFHLSAERLTQTASLSKRLQAVRGPVMSDDMVLLRQLEYPPSVETFIFSELCAAHVVDEGLLISMLRHHAFGAVVTEYDPGDATFMSRYRPATTAALLAAYPHVTSYGDFRLRLP